MKFSTLLVKTVKGSAIRESHRRRNSWGSKNRSLLVPRLLMPQLFLKKNLDDEVGRRFAPEKLKV